MIQEGVVSMVTVSFGKSAVAISPQVNLHLWKVNSNEHIEVELY